MKASTLFSLSFAKANKLTEPGSMPKCVFKRSGDAKLKRDESNAEDKALRSTFLSSGTVTKKCRMPFLSRKNKFFVDAPFNSGESFLDSSTVKTAGWS